MELNFDTAKEMATKYAKKFNKQVIGAKENADYWFFEADNDEHPIDDGAGSCYVSKSDGSLQKLDLVDIDFNSRFNQTATDIDF